MNQPKCFVKDFKLLHENVIIFTVSGVTMSEVLEVTTVSCHIYPTLALKGLKNKIYINKCKLSFGHKENLSKFEIFDIEMFKKEQTRSLC